MNLPQWPNLCIPPPNFSVPPPGIRPMNFPGFSGPIYNQPTFPISRMHSPQPPHNSNNMPPHLFRGQNSPQGGPRFNPLGFSNFIPRQPPPLPNPINHQQGARGNRGGARGHFNRGRNKANGFSNRGRGAYPVIRNDERKEPFYNNGNDVNTNGNGNQKQKKPKVDKRDLPENNVFYCDVCDRGFKTEEKYLEHIGGHQKCSFDDCPFVAAPKLVMLHMNLQHRGGMAKKIWSVESEEDIKKWKEERKRNYPTVDNIKKKKEIVEERLSRGEMIETKDFSKMTKGQGHHDRGRRGRGRGRGGRFRRGRGYNDNRGDRENVSHDDGVNGHVDDDGPPEEMKIQRGREKDVIAGNNTQEENNDGDDLICEGRVSKENADVVQVSTENSKKKKTGLTLLSGYESSPSDSESSGNDSDDAETTSKPHIEAGNTSGLLSTSVSETSSLLSSSCPSMESSSSDKVLTHSPAVIVIEDSDGSEVEIVHPNEDDDCVWQSGKSVVGTEHDGDKQLDEHTSEKKRRQDSAGSLNIDKKGQTSRAPSETSLCDSRGEAEPLMNGKTGGSSPVSHVQDGGECAKTKMADVTSEAVPVKGFKRGHMTNDGPSCKKSKFTPKPQQKSYTLLEKLLAKEIRRERNKVLQCVHFFVKNKFFEDELAS